MSSKALLYTILYAVIAYGIIYVFFVRPKPAPSQDSSNQSSSNSASKQSQSVSQDGLPDGFISIAIDSKGNVVKEEVATGHLDVPISSTPAEFCFNGKTYRVSRPTSGVVDNGKLLLSGVSVSVSEGCYSGKLI